jgi:hypothetical protein
MVLRKDGAEIGNSGSIEHDQEVFWSVRSSLSLVLGAAALRTESQYGPAN